MSVDDHFERYRKLQSYVGWTDQQGQRVAAVAPLLEPVLAAIVDDFYATIAAHEATRSIITGGDAQVERLKVTLRAWLVELLSGRHDRDYVTRRWQVGRRHVEIGLDQVYINAALSRVRPISMASPRRAGAKRSSQPRLGRITSAQTSTSRPGLR